MAHSAMRREYGPLKTAYSYIVAFPYYAVVHRWMAAVRGPGIPVPIDAGRRWVLKGMKLTAAHSKANWFPTEGGKCRRQAAALCWVGDLQ